MLIIILADIDDYQKILKGLCFTCKVNITSLHETVY